MFFLTSKSSTNAILEFFFIFKTMATMVLKVHIEDSTILTFHKNLMLILIKKSVKCESGSRTDSSATDPLRAGMDDGTISENHQKIT